jgi:hypothetical protein
MKLVDQILDSYNEGKHTLLEMEVLLDHVQYLDPLEGYYETVGDCEGLAIGEILYYIREVENGFGLYLYQDYELMLENSMLRPVSEGTTQEMTSNYKYYMTKDVNGVSFIIKELGDSLYSIYEFSPGPLVWIKVSQIEFAKSQKSSISYSEALAIKAQWEKLF